MSTSIAVVVALLAGRCLLTASEKQPLTASVKADYQTVRNFVVRAAERCPPTITRWFPHPVNGASPSDTGRGGFLEAAARAGGQP